MDSRCVVAAVGTRGNVRKREIEITSTSPGSWEPVGVHSLLLVVRYDEGIRSMNYMLVRNKSSQRKYKTGEGHINHRHMCRKLRPNDIIYVLPRYGDTIIPKECSTIIDWLSPEFQREVTSGIESLLIGDNNLFVYGNAGNADNVDIAVEDIVDYF